MTSLESCAAKERVPDWAFSCHTRVNTHTAARHTEERMGDRISQPSDVQNLHIELAPDQGHLTLSQESYTNVRCMPNAVPAEQRHPEIGILALPLISKSPMEAS